MADATQRRLARLRRSAVACQRCRRRKQKCDLKYPQCSSCESAQAQCLSYHAGKEEEIPRDYFSNLEEQVERLKQELNELRAQSSANGHGQPGLAALPTVSPHSDSQDGTEQSSPSQQELVQSLAMVVLEGSEAPRFVGISSGVTLAKLVMESVGCNAPNLSASPRKQRVTVYMPETKSSLPPPTVAAHLMDVYFQGRTSHIPLMSRADILASIQNSYLVASHDESSEPIRAPRDLFITFMIFAISLCGLETGSGERPLESAGCYNSALQHLDSALSSSQSDIETLALILLLGQYIALSPSKGNLWLLTGLALRICVSLGLHWESDAVLQLQTSQINERRRLFWATYNFERLLAITLGRPFSLDEQSIDIGFPDPGTVGETPGDIHSQSVANHLIHLTKLESEIKHVLYRQQRKVSAGFPRPDYSIWIMDFRPRLEEWQASIPKPQNAHPKSLHASNNWWDAVYSNTLLLLHRPNPVVSEPSPESLRICFEASSKMISCIKILQRENKLEMLWIWVQRLFVAGLTFIYSVWNSAEVRGISSPEDIISIAQTCSTTLAILTVKFPGAAGCRDTLESLVSATVKALFSPQNGRFSKPEKRAIQQDMSEPEPQIADLDNSIEAIYSMLTVDAFGFGQELPLASGWPVHSDDSGFDIPGEGAADLPEHWPAHTGSQPFSSFM